MPQIPNNNDTKRMHETFLQDVRKQIAETEQAIAEKKTTLLELQTVEKYHENVLMTLNPKLRIPLQHEDNPTIEPKEPIEVIDFSGKTRHEVICIALKSLGGSARIPAIVEWLQAHNYGGNYEDAIFRTMIFTAMKRHEELFKRTLREGKSIWKLVGKETAEPA